MTKSPSFSVPAIDALMNADDELALVTDDADLTRLTAVSYRRRDGALTGHHADGSTRDLGRLAKPMIGRLQTQTTVLVVIQMRESDVQE
ncbi:MAG: hypothetical protein AAF556_06565, partial [Pseudomonadota bacterium]